MTRDNPEPSYDELRMAWRSTLSDYQVRQLASDYLMGKRDESTRDALDEFNRRWPNGREVPTEKRKKVPKRR